MYNRKNWIAVNIVFLSLLMFLPVAQAQRQDIESQKCYVQIWNVVTSSPEMSVFTYDQKGIMQSSNESKLFDNWTDHTVGIVKSISGKASWNGFAKETAPDGEFIIWELYGDSESKTTTGKAIYGTGKWKNVKGERKTSTIASGRPFVPNSTLAMCLKVVGWIELPK
jgi:hypothetical protein